MKNYTTQTASLKATTIDTRIANAKKIDTERLFIKGIEFDPSQIKESPNEATFSMMIVPTPADEEKGLYSLESFKLN